MIKRYEIYVDGNEDDTYLAKDEEASGEWVRFSDHEQDKAAAVKKAIWLTLKRAEVICEKDAAEWEELANSPIGGRCDGVQAQGSKECAKKLHALAEAEK